MALEQIGKATVAATVAGVIILFGMHSGPRKVHADDNGQGQGQGQGQGLDNDQMLATIGLRIMPSFVKLNGKDPTLVL